LGGGMRQAGVLAAAGIVALNDMVERLCDDHATARLLAEGLARIPGVVVRLEMVRTNMVFFELAPDVDLSSDDVAKMMRETANVWVGTNGARGFRAVTHYWIGPGDVRTFLAVLERVLERA
jgi:threonine aldolase